MSWSPAFPGSCAPRKGKRSTTSTVPLSGRCAAAPAESPASLVGIERVVDVGPVAHGGHCVARLHGRREAGDGRVVFVRHALPGERVRIRVTEGEEGSRFLRADAIEVLEASPHRAVPPCPYAGPGRCGGCDFQHSELAYQRELKADVVREQFSRLAHLDVDVTVEPLPGDGALADGLRWRTRVEFAVDGDGRAGLRKHRSHDVLAVRDCLISDERIVATGVLGRTWKGSSGVDVVAASDPAAAVLVPLPDGRDRPVIEHVATPGWSADFRVGARGFWQVHPSAASTFASHLLAEVDPRPGERVLDLYAGVGLFALAFADRVGPAGSVLAVEGSRSAVADGALNTAGRPYVEWRHGRVDRVLKTVVTNMVSADVVVLDPPRTGAGRDVCRSVIALSPRLIGYVACDPAALARDTAYLGAAGYHLTSLRAFDAFPMTHHVECIAVFAPDRRR